MKNDCYDCPYRGQVPGSAHSKCNTISEGALAIAFSIKVASGEVTGIDSDKGQLLKFDPHGVANGWCAWPVNFDPVWVECRLPIKQETKSRYDWNRFPKWVQWVATDPDGRVWGYSSKPEFDKSINAWDGGNAKFFELGDPTDWKNSLEERPKIKAIDKKTFYIASTHYNKVGTIEVDSETKDCVYVEGQRVFKKSGHQFIDKSREKAVQFLIDKWEAEVWRYERGLAEYKAKLDEAKAIVWRYERGLAEYKAKLDEAKALLDE